MQACLRRWQPQSDHRLLQSTRRLSQPSSMLEQRRAPSSSILASRMTKPSQHMLSPIASAESGFFPQVSWRSTQSLILTHCESTW